MLADGADFRRGGGDVDMAAVAAFPAVFAGADPDFSGFDVGEELAVAFLVALLDGGDALELGGDVVEAFCARLFGEALVHVGPFLAFAVCGGLQVFDGGADSAEVLEPELGVFLFIVGGLEEERGDLLEAFLLGLAGEVGVFVACLGFACERESEVFFGLAAFQFHDENPFMGLRVWIGESEGELSVRFCVIFCRAGAADRG